MNNQDKSEALFGNHEDLLLDYYDKTNKYGPGIWQFNGGSETIKSFGGLVPKNVINWIRTLKTSVTLLNDNKNYFISHTFKTIFDKNDILTSLWNRRQPEMFVEYDIQIAGHNSQFGLRYWNFPNNKQAICIDTSAKRILTGIHIPSMNIYQQKFID